MWKLYQTAQQTHSRPSDLVCLDDRLAAYIFDSTVVTFGTIMENALNERVNVAPMGKLDYQPKYKITQLLDDKFFLPDPSRPIKIGSSISSLPPFQSGISQILALAEQNTQGIKKWVYAPPEEQAE